jgi:hypothetical protein
MHDILMPKHLVFSLIVDLKKGCRNLIIVMGRAENISSSAIVVVVLW